MNKIKENTELHQKIKEVELFLIEKGVSFESTGTGIIIHVETEQGNFEIVQKQEDGSCGIDDCFPGYYGPVYWQTLQDFRLG